MPLTYLTDEAVRNGHLWSSSDSGQSWREHDIRITADEILWLGMTELDEWMTVGRLLFDPTEPGGHACLDHRLDEPE